MAPRYVLGRTEMRALTEAGYAPHHEYIARFGGVYIPEDDESDRKVSPVQLWGTVFLFVGFVWFMAGVASLVWLTSVLFGA